MAAGTGFAIAALQYGYNSRIPKAERRFGKFKGYITMEEVHTDELEITEHPIEQGASITDHAYKRPAELRVRIGWSNSPSGAGLLGGIRGLLSTGSILVSNVLGNNVNQVKEIYQKLLKAQADREPMEVMTGKRTYTNMLIKSLVVTTDRTSENVLDVTISFQQIILVTTQVATIERVPPANQRNAPATQAPTNAGAKAPKPTSNVDGAAMNQFVNPR